MPLVKQVGLGVTPENGFGKATTQRGGGQLMFGLFGRREERLAPVNALFARVAEASRAPALYLEGGVPDTFEGRFDSLALHAFLVMRRLRQLPPPAADLSQDFVDACFAYLELGFRNGGISDVAVPKRMKKIAESFYGRVQAYEAAVISSDPDALAGALARNLGSRQGSALLADYARRAEAGLLALDLDALLARPVLFPDPSATGGVDDR
jgi:cytochrome b pre-mRNA-processing protein 3